MAIATPVDPLLAARGSGALPAIEEVPGVASILLVDDHPSNLLALEGILEPLGQRLVKATSGEEALKHLLHNDFAVILMDVQMPGLDGIQTARLIKERERTRHIPIIFLTAISREQTHVFKGYSSGAVDYLLKPFDPDILRAKVSVFVSLFVKQERLKQQELELRMRERVALERQSELRFQNVTESLPNCVLAGRIDGSLYWCNREWHEYSGLSLEESAKVGIEGALHPDDRDRFLAARARFLAAGVPMELELRVRRRDGLNRWFLLRAVAERDEQGRFNGFIATATDVDDQKRDREALSHFKATLDATIDCVLMLQPSDLRICYANQGAVTQLGRSRDEIETLRLTDIEPEHDEQTLRAMLAPLTEGKLQSLTYRTDHPRTEGEPIPVEVVVQYVVHDGAAGRFIAVARDITERARAEQAMRRANEAKDAFIAAASHELRTPLAAAKAQAQLAVRRLRDDPESMPARALRSISSQIDRMAKLVEDLLDVSRVQVGRLSLEITEFDFCEMLRECCERIQALSEIHTINIELCDHPVKIDADRGRLDQVLTNLFSNAIRYSPSGGTVVVRIEADEVSVHVSVTDQGVGIPKDKQDLIFERFGRAHGSKYGGLGLGLTISQGIVEQHGGTIWVESSGVAGEGSTFHVRLPLHTSPGVLG